MSRLRSVSTAFWSDPLVEELNPHEKLLFLYLITNEKTNMLGIYENSVKKTAFETGLTTAQVEAIYKRFEQLKRVRRLNGWLMVLNFAKHQNYNTNMKKSAIDCYLALPEELQNPEIQIDRDNPTEGFESILKHLGMVRNPSVTVRKVEVEYEVEVEGETETEIEAAKAEKKISSISKFETSREQLINAAKELYPDKDCGKAFDSMLEWAKMKGATYKDWKLAYFRWVREDRFGDFSGGVNTDPNFVSKVKEYKRKLKDGGYYIDDVGGWEKQNEFMAYTFMVPGNNTRGLVLGNKANVERRLTERPGWERLTPVSL